MNKEINAYAEYLLNFGVVKKPPMPNFDVSAYTDNVQIISCCKQSRCRSK